MHCPKRVILLITLLSIFFNLSAQNRKSPSTAKATAAELKQELVKYKNLSYGKMIRYASMLENEGSYVNAVEYYKMAHAKKPTNKCVLQKLSELNFKLRDFVTSEEYTRKLIDLDKNYDKDAELRLALCMKANMKYKDALEELKYISANKKSSESMKKVENEIKGAELALESKNRPDPKTAVENVRQINGYLQEYAPQPLKGDNIIYSSLISDTALNVTRLKYEGKDYTSKLVFTRFEKDKNLFTPPQLLPQEINAPEIHIGNGFIDESSKRIYYTQCKEDQRLNMKCRLWMAVKKGNTWEASEIKKINDKGTTNSQPAIYDDGSGTKYLLFSSDRNGGKGGMDIWYSKIDTQGRVGDPANLSAANTFGDEVTPFYHKKDKTLYFSSNGYPSFGGHDIFKMQGTISKWDKVINLKYPINSSVDDLYLKLDENDEGYFVSNRTGSKSPRGYTCCDDIWSVRKSDYSLWMKGIYVSSTDELKKPLNGTDALMIDKDGKLVIRKVTEKDSHFLVKVTPGQTYRVNGLKAGYYPGIDSFSTPKELYKNDTIYRTFYLDPIEKKRYVVENVYYAFDKSVVRPEYYNILDSVYSLMNIFPNLFLKIDGHTDGRGTEVYNQALSERRCKAAAEYLLIKGLSPERIIMRGYSELVPIAPNVTPSNEDDPAGRAKNRRVEFKLLSPSGKDPKYDIDYRVNIPFGIE
jgi:outer membrane protein OmpA-like peptidoglycan-associated protein/tetratricopeptide (TPR) repeat protein